MAEAVFEAVERLSHAYIVSAPTQEECAQHAKHLAAAAVCSGSRRPCGVCRNCRKAEAGIHPDISVISRLSDDKGNLKKNLLVDQTRELAVDAYVLPNEAEGKAYIIQDADTMNTNAQNAALKLLEEPPKGVVFILCVTNPAALLPTVRSRCVELSFGGANAEQNMESVKMAEEFVKAVASRKDSVLFRWCSKNESIDVHQCAEFIDTALDYAADMLCGRRSMEKLSMGELMHLTDVLSRCREYMKVNVSVKHIFGLLSVNSILETETEEK